MTQVDVLAELKKLNTRRCRTGRPSSSKPSWLSMPTARIAAAAAERVQ